LGGLGNLEFFYNISKVYYFYRYFIIKRIVMAALKQVQDDKTYLNTRKIVMAGTETSSG